MLVDIPLVDTFHYKPKWYMGINSAHRLHLAIRRHFQRAHPWAAVPGSQETGFRVKQRQLLRPAFAAPAIGLALACLLPAAQGQVAPRPDTGSLLERPSQLPALPPAGGPRIQVPAPVATPAAASAISLVPAAFRFEGNTVFATDVLAALLSAQVGQPTDLNGLTQAARVVRDFYREQGYLLSDAYIPAQQFSAAGGTVTIAIIEARVGRASIRIDGEGDGAARALAGSVLAANLRPGDLITAYSLEKPVLLLRDIAGFEASASVEPGQRTGEADVQLLVKPAGLKMEASLGLDNYGVRSSGSIRSFASGSVITATGRGDVLSGRVQLAEVSGSRLYRLGYSLPVGGLGTRLSLDFTRSEYALGKEFAALGATGVADIVSLSAVQPVYRARERNLFLSAALERKSLHDQTSTPASQSDKTINDVRAGVLGNFSDGLLGDGAFNSYALSMMAGQFAMDANSQLTDQGPGGLNTAGRFGKFNLELQRVQYLDRSSQIQLSAQGQMASRNLPSAEKMVLGGPTGVRGYAAGEGAGDSGTLFSAEYRYLLPPAVSLLGEPVSLVTFADRGRVRINQSGAPAGGAGSIDLASTGLGLIAGRSGNYLLSAWVAFGLSGSLQGSADGARRARLWVSFQKWL